MSPTSQLNPEPRFQIGSRVISASSPCYFIADVASSHDGQLSRAKDLIWLAKQSGADCVKFQHFKAESIVSDRGFKSLGSQTGHQSTWKESVFDVFKRYELNREWNEVLWKEAQAAEIEFMTTPYDFEAVEQIDPLVRAYKVGSGDVTWLDFLRYLARKGKPVLLATGASDMNEVEQAYEALRSETRQIALLQCNTNYTGSLENFRYVNLSVLKTFANRFPEAVLGLSDHTPGHATVLGAIALGARIVEKHFTDDNGRDGPDHAFSMNPASWSDMISRSRELEAAFGDGEKRVEENEKQTVVLQRRCLRASRDLEAGAKLSAADFEALRPAPRDAISPARAGEIVGHTLLAAKVKGDALTLQDLA